MSEATVAIRYAKSLIDLAQEQNLTEEVFNDMIFFKQTADENRGLMLALKSPVVRHEKKLGLLDQIFKSRVHPVTFSIFNIITRKNRESIMYAIADEFVKLYDDRKGIVKAQITTATPLASESKKQFETIVADSTKKTVQLEEKIDPSLIGGYLLRVGDRQIDTSVKKRLNDLKLSLLK
jgi:F-type H+-transporting ATPase subunit delta